MIDWFAVLKQPRRPWLDPEQLKQKYHELARTEHPDRKVHEAQQVSGDVQGTLTLAALNEGYAALANPKLRLRHLLELEGDATASGVIDLPSDLGDLFMEAATLVREVDLLVQKRDGSSTALAKSLLKTETATLSQRTKFLSEKLNQVYAVALEDLQRADEFWISDRPKAVGELRRLIQRFAYLDRWIDQLREKQFQLST